jgi:hypothetical protein
VAARPRIPCDENAAFDLLDAFTVLGDEPTRADELLEWAVLHAAPLGWRNSEAILQLGQTRRPAFGEAFGLVQRAAQLDACMFPINSADGPGYYSIDHLSDASSAARKLCSQAVLCSQAGDTRGSARALCGVATIATSLDGAVSLSEASTRDSVERACAAAVEQTLGLCELPAEDLAAVRQAIAREEERLSIHNALIGERTSFRWTVQCYLYDSACRTLEGRLAAWRLLYMAPGWREQNELFLLEAVSDAARIAALPVMERSREVLELETRCSGGPGESSLRLGLQAILVSDAVDAIREEISGHARLRASIAALAVEGWRIAHGAWPESLDVLVPEMLAAVPGDPYSGKPLGYRRRDDGFVVYSVGPDGKDDGGVTRDEVRDPRGESPNEGWDIAFRLLNPDRRGARAMAFRDELTSMEDNVTARELALIGFPLKRLLELGLTDEDIWQLRY